MNSWQIKTKITANKGKDERKINDIKEITDKLKAIIEKKIADVK